MIKTMKNKFFVLIQLVFITLLFAVTPAWSADKSGSSLADRYKSRSSLSDRYESGSSLTDRQGKKNDSQKSIEKVGFFSGVVNDRVKIKNKKNYKMESYLVAPDMIVTKEEQPIDILKVWPDSIVKLIIVDAEVVEIILLQESS